MSKTFEERFWEKVDQSAGPFGCWIWTARMDGGNGRIKRPDGSLGLAHRVAWELTYGAIPENKDLRRNCENSVCVNPYHMFLDGREHIQENLKLGRKGKPGERNPLARLDRHQVREIRARFDPSTGMTCEELAKTYNVARTTISNVVHGHTWKWLKE